MSERTEVFDVGARPRLEVKLSSGSLYLLPGPPGVVEATVRSRRRIEDFVMEQRGDTVTLYSQRGIGGASYDVTVKAPEGTEVEAKTAAADISAADVELGDVRATLASGELRIRCVAGDLTVRAASGDAHVGRVAGRLRVALASGDLRVDEVAGDAEANSASGDIFVGVCAGRVEARSASGDVTIASWTGPDLNCKTMSGDVRVGVPTGRTLDVDFRTISGDVRNEFPVTSGVAEGDNRSASLNIKTLSGDIVLTSA